MATFYVSPTGSDKAAGTSPTTAFATLAKAQAAMQASAGADTAYLEGGTYSTPLRLTAQDANETWAAYNGQTPIITGGATVTGWTADANGVWTAHVSSSDVQQLVVNGVPQHEARFPNYDPSNPLRGGWAWAKALPKGSNGTKQLAYDKTTFPAGSLVAGEKIVVVDANSYSSDVLTIKSVNTATGVMTFTTASDYKHGPGARFYVEGGPAGLDKPGEWSFDKASQTLRYMAPAGFNGANAVVSGQAGDLVSVTGASNVAFKGITFNNVGTNSAYGDAVPAAVNVVGSSGIRIEDSTFSNVASGVIIDGSSGVSVLNNTLTNILSAAVQVNPTSSQNTISGNTITNSNTLYFQLGAIQMTESWGNTVTHNLIQNVPRFGIADVNYDPAIKSGGNTISNNILRHTGQQTTDVGAIYVIAGADDQALGDTISSNLIVDTGGLTATASGTFVTGQDFSNGVYLDDNASNATVSGNFIYGTGESGVKLHGGTNNKVTNNVILKAGQWSVETLGIDKPMAGTDISHNLLDVSTSTESPVAIDISATDPTASHDNVIFNPAGKALLNYGEEAWDQWLQSGGDEGTATVTDPGFTNPTAGDYSFAPGSKALAAGIAQVAWSDFGPAGGAVNVFG